jgi:hypothetical protein
VTLDLALAGERRRLLAGLPEPQRFGEEGG